MRRRRKIPFWLSPKSWFSTGDNHRLAEIDHYYRQGSYDWEIKRAEILGRTEMERAEEQLRIKLKHEKLTEHEFDIEMVKLHYDPKVDEYKYKKAMIEIDHKHGEINDHQREKELATLNEEPWHHFVLVSDPEDPDFGTFTGDYNDYYVDWLRDHGYEGDKSDDVIENYLNHICKYVAIGAFDGVGDFSERISDSEIASNRYIKERTAPSKTRSDDGRATFE